MVLLLHTNRLEAGISRAVRQFFELWSRNNRRSPCILASLSSSSATMLRRLVLPFASRAGQRLSSTTVPEEHRDKFDPENPNYTKFEVVEDPDVWSHVERLIPDKRVPPMPDSPGPSGWQPVRLTKAEVSAGERFSQCQRIVVVNFARENAPISENFLFETLDMSSMTYGRPLERRKPYLNRNTSRQGNSRTSSIAPKIICCRCMKRLKSEDRDT